MSLLCILVPLWFASTMTTSKLQVRLIDEIKSTLPVKDSATIARLLAAQSPTGSWSDINYHDTARTNWKPQQHLERTIQILSTTQMENWKDLRKNEAIRRALDFYINYTYPGARCLDRTTMKIVPSPCYIQSRNWWYNQVGEGLLLGKILMVSEGHFDDSTIFRWSERISSTLGSLSDTTTLVGGANLFWEGEALIYKSLVQHKPKVVDSILGLFRKATTLSTVDEGIQPDMSFNQHGFIQTGSYGQGVLDMSTRWMHHTDSTPNQWSQTERKRLVDYLLDGCIPMIDHGIFDPSVIGRDISRNSTHSSEALANILTAWSGPTFSGYRKTELQEARKFLSTGDWPWPHRRGWIYPNNYLLVYHGDGWSFSWHGCPKGQIGTENVNGENLRGMLLPFGCYWLRNRAQDSRLFPLLDWNHLPGTTLPQGYQAPTSLFKTGNLSLPPQMSCTQTRCTIDYDFNVSGTTGHQSIALNKDTIQIRGTHFSTPKTGQLEANVDQKIVVAPITIRSNNGKSWLLQDTASDFSSLEHDGLVYHFPVGTKVKAQIRNIPRNWMSINHAESNLVVSEEILSISIAAIDYQYIITSKHQSRF